MRFLWFSSVKHTPRTKPSPFQRWAGLSQLFISFKGRQRIGAIICTIESNTCQQFIPRVRLVTQSPTLLCQWRKSLLQKIPWGKVFVATSPMCSTARHVILWENLFLCFKTVERFPGFPSVNGKQLVIAEDAFPIHLWPLRRSSFCFAHLIFVGNNCDKV